MENQGITSKQHTEPQGSGVRDGRGLKLKELTAQPGTEAKTASNAKARLG